MYVRTYIRTYVYCTLIVCFLFLVVPYNVMISEAIVNGTIIYTCYSDGGPGNLYHWMRQGGGSFTISQQLVFTMKVQSNEGTYECTVDNDAGRKTVSITLSGKYVSLNCHISSLNMYSNNNIRTCICTYISIHTYTCTHNYVCTYMYAH